jgi:addiction module HigA family antidote
MVKKEVSPVHPGEILLDEFLKPMGLSQYRLAKEVNVPPRRINEIVHGKRAITADTALRLARFFGTTERFWLNLQTRYDLEVEKDRPGGHVMDKQLCVCTETDSGFRYWSSLPSLTGEIRKAVRQADIVLVPYEGFRNYQGPVFPVGTEELFQIIREQVPTGMEVELAIEDADYKELALHSDIVTIADFLVKYLAAPVAVALITAYLKKRLGGRFSSTQVRASMIVDHSKGDTRQAMRISYEGSATAFERSVKEALTTLAGQQQRQLDNKSNDPADHPPRMKKR